MVKGILKAAVASAIGFLAMGAGFFLLALHPGPPVISNERLVAELLGPLAFGVIVGVAVYRILDG